MQTRRLDLTPPPRRAAINAALIFSAALILSATLAPSARAQDPSPEGPASAAAQAREDYQRCLDLKTLRRYCTALDACEEGLEVHPTNTALAALAEDLRKRCEAEEHRPNCGFGLLASSRTAWNCCWPGQTWDGKSCQGDPTHCDPHFDLDLERRRCVPKQCEGGQYHVDGVHCCWPGQRWSRSREVCIYQPRCPEGFELYNDTCRALGGCPTGQLRSDGMHCCWLGQRWSDATNACIGTAKCPPNTTPSDSGGCDPNPPP
jgi:hypothetical protein